MGTSWGGGGWIWLFELLTLAGLALLVVVAVPAFGGGGISRGNPRRRVHEARSCRPLRTMR